MRLLAAGEDIASLNALVWSRRVNRNATLCVHDLHGRCSSTTCKALHVDLSLSGWSDRELLNAVISDFKNENEAAEPATDAMFQRGITSAAVIAHQSLSDGVPLTRCISKFFSALLPLSKITLGK